MKDEKPLRGWKLVEWLEKQNEKERIRSERLTEQIIDRATAQRGSAATERAG